jgi:hypothetical protein
MSGRVGHVGSAHEPTSRSCTRRGVSVRAPLGVFFFLVIALASGCQDLCLRHSDCPPGYVCEATGLCDIARLPAPSQPDGGTPLPDPPDSSTSGDDAGAETGADAGEPADGGDGFPPFPFG